MAESWPLVAGRDATGPAGRLMAWQAHRYPEALKALPETLPETLGSAINDGCHSCLARRVKFLLCWVCEVRRRSSRNPAESLIGVSVKVASPMRAPAWDILAVVGECHRWRAISSRAAGSPNRVSQSAAGAFAGPGLTCAERNTRTWAGVLSFRYTPHVSPPAAGGRRWRGPGPEAGP